MKKMMMMVGAALFGAVQAWGYNLVQNGDFSSHNISSGSFAYGFNGAWASSWTFHSNAGIDNQSGVWIKSASYQGATAFLQGATDGARGYINQQIYFPVTGTYRFRFQLVCRGASFITSSGNVNVEARLGDSNSARTGSYIKDCYPSSYTSWTQFDEQMSVSRGNHYLQFYMYSGSDGDRGACVDNVEVTLVNTTSDPVACYDWQGVRAVLEAGMSAKLMQDIDANRLGSEYDVYVNRNATLDLNGHTITMQNAANASHRLFRVDNSATFNLTNSVETVGTITSDGTASSLFGAVVQVFGTGSRLIVSDRVKIRNVKSSHSSYGGGAFFIEGTGTSIVMNGGVIEGCSATAGYGGAICGYTSSKANTIILNGTVITNCTASRHGGAIYNTGTNILTGVTIAGCSATYGGAVYVYSGSFTLNDGVISNCTATSAGGAIYTVSGYSSTIYGGCFQDNRVNGSATATTALFGGDGTTTVYGGVADTSLIGDKKASGKTCLQVGDWWVVGSGIVTNADKLIGGAYTFNPTNAQYVATGIVDPAAVTAVGSGTDWRLKLNSGEPIECQTWEQVRACLEGGNSVKLMQDIDANRLGSEYDVHVSRNATLDLNGHTITMKNAANASHRLFRAGSGSTFNLTNSVETVGTITSDGTASSHYGAVVQVTGTGSRLIVSDRVKIRNVKSSNSSYGGGAFFIESTGTSIVMNGGVIEGCSATAGYGGAICGFTGSKANTIILNGTVITNCTASQQGGAIYNTGTNILNGVTIVGCSATYGGGIYGYTNSTLVATGSAIVGCRVTGSGGGIYGSTAHQTLTDCRVEDCTSSSTVGGICNGNGGDLTLNECLVASCVSTNYAGGIYTSGPLTMNGGMITNCLSRTNNGGGVFITGRGKMTLNDGRIVGCRARAYGGGIYQELSSGTGLVINSGAIENNVAETGYGGGIYSLGSFWIYGGVIRGNWAKTYGGGIYANGANVERVIYGGLIAGNTTESGTNPNIRNYDGKTILKGLVCDCAPTEANFNTGCSAALSGTTSVKVGDYWIVGAKPAYVENDLTGGTYSFCPTNAEYAVCGFAVDPELVSLSTVRSTTWTIQAKAPVDCSTWAEIASNLTAGNDVRMTTNVIQDSTCSFSVPAGAKRMLDMNGYTITCASSSAGRAFTVSGWGEMLFLNGTYDGLSLASNQGQFLYLNTAKATFERVTIRNCRANASGGAIYGLGVTLTIKGGLIENCSTTYSGGAIYIGGGSSSRLQMTDGAEIANCGASAEGGAVRLEQGSFDFDDGLIRNCAATNNGGAVSLYYYGGQQTFTMNGGVISNCTATTGGAIYVPTNIAVKVNGGTIMDCTAKAYGGGIYNYFGTVTMNGGTITNCNALANGGGGINSDGTVILNDGLIAGCRSTFGGGIRMSENPLSSLTMNGGTISGNTATNDATGCGGGLYVRTFRMNGGTICNNRAGSQGGSAIFVDGDSYSKYIYGGVIVGNTSTSASTPSVRLARGSLTIKGLVCDVEPSAANFKSSGTYSVDPYKKVGDLWVVGQGVAAEENKIVGGAFTFNPTNAEYVATGVVDPAAVKVEKSGSTWVVPRSYTTWDQVKAALEAGTSVTLDADIEQTSECVISGGPARVLDLNGHTITGASTNRFFTVNDATFTIDGDGVLDGACRTNVSSGACIYSRTNATVTLKSGTLRNFHVSHEGAAIRVAYGRFTMDGGTIEDCVAAHYGGAILGSRSTFTINGGLIRNCTATSSGGGAVLMEYTNASLLMNGGVIEGCTTVCGGAIYLYSTGPSFTMRGGTIRNCAATSGGGAVYNSQGSVTLYGGTIENCSATSAGGAIYTYSGYTTTIYGCYLKGNTAGGSATAATALFGGDGTTSVYGGVADTSLIGNKKVSGKVCTQVGANWVVGQGLMLADGTLLGANLTFCPTNAEYAAAGLVDPAVSAPIGSGTSWRLKPCSDEPVECSDWARICALLEAGANVKLMANINQDTTCSIPLNRGTFTFDLNGYTISRTVATKPFYVNLGNTFTIKNGTFDGNSSLSFAADGHFLACYEADVTLQALKILNCKNNNSSYWGTIFIQSSGKVTMDGGLISSCTTEGDGAAVYLYGPNASFTMNNGARIESCTAKGNGGAIYVLGGSGSVNNITINSGSIYNCTATANGGGLYLGPYCNFHMYGGDIYNCTAGAEGGGIYTLGAWNYIYGGSIHDNRANGGGGGAIRFTSDTDWNYIYGGSFYGNYCSTYGGAFSTARSIEIHGGYFSGNSAGTAGPLFDYDGSGKYIYVYGLVSYGYNPGSDDVDCILSGGASSYSVGSYYVVAQSLGSSGNYLTSGRYTFDPTARDYIGRVSAEPGRRVAKDTSTSPTTYVIGSILPDPVPCSEWNQVRLNLQAGRSVRLTQNVTQDSSCSIPANKGALMLDLDAYAITRSTYHASYAFYHGASGTELTIRNGTYNGNGYASSGTFVQQCSSGARTILENVTITNCVAKSRNAYCGAALYCTGGSLTMKGGRIADCYSDYRGGAVYAVNSSTTFKMTDGATIERCSTGNYDSNAGGGAICATSDGTVDIDGGIIRDCTSANKGGAIYLSASTATARLNETLIENCEAGYAGAFYNWGRVGIDGCIIRACVSKIGGGGAISALGGSTVSVTETLIENCEAAMVGGAIYNAGTNTLVRSTLTGNVATNGAALTVAVNAYSKIYDCVITNNLATGPGGGALQLRADAGNAVDLYGAVIRDNGENDFAIGRANAFTVHGGVFGADPKTAANLKIATGADSVLVGESYVVGSNVVHDIDLLKLTGGTYTFNPTNDPYLATGVAEPSIVSVTANEAAKPVTYTLGDLRFDIAMPEVAHAAVTNATVNGLHATIIDGKVKAPAGATVVIWFAPHDGYFLTGATTATLVGVGPGQTTFDVSEVTTRWHHTHCICGDGACEAEGHEHADIEWQRWYSATSLPTAAGSWYLVSNVTLSAAYVPVDGVNLCLNGKVVKAASDKRIATINSGMTFQLTDCEQTVHKFTVGANYVWTLNESGGTRSLTGGCLAGGSTADGGAGIYNNGTFKMYAGNIVGNATTDYHDYFGGGVLTYGTFTMNGGTLIGNRAGYGGGVAVRNSGRFIANGGKINENATLYQGGALCANGGFTLANVEMRGNHADGGEGGAIHTWYDTGSAISSSISKSVIAGNFAKTAGAIHLVRQSLTLVDVVVTNNTATTSEGAIQYNALTVGQETTLILGGTTKIIDNKAAGAASNVGIVSGKTITVSTATPLAEGAKIGVTTATAPVAGTPVVITTTNAADCSTFFTSDDANYYANNGADNVVQLSLVGAGPTVKDKDNKDVVVEIPTEWRQEQKVTPEEVMKPEQKMKNGHPAWQNYVLGIEPTNELSGVYADAPQNKATDKVTIETRNVDPAKVVSGYTVQYRLDKKLAGASEYTKGEKQNEPSFDVLLNGDDPSGVYKLSTVIVKDGVELDQPAEAVNAIGLVKATNTNRFAIVAVPWSRLAPGEEEEIAVSNVLKTATLEAGDKLHVFNRLAKTYDTWTLNEQKEWDSVQTFAIAADGTLSASVSGASATETIARGSGIWLERMNPTNAPYFLYGQVSASELPAILPGHNLVGAPGVEAFDFSRVKGAAEGDQILVPGVVPKLYELKNGVWGYFKTVVKEINVKGTIKTSFKAEWTTTENTIPAGTGYWLINKSGNAITIE